MSWLSNIFDKGKRDTSYTGPRPPSTQTSLAGGQNLYNEITGRLAGRGVGFGDNYADITSNPIIKQMKSNFNSYTMPEYKSFLSATGRKSTGGSDLVRRAMMEQGNQEGAVYSGLYQQNEAQKRNEINDSLARLQAYVGNEANMGANRANFEYADNQRQVSETKDRDQISRDMAMRGIGAAAMMIPGGQGIGMNMMANGAGGGNAYSTFPAPWMGSEWTPSRGIPAGYSPRQLSERFVNRGSR